MKTTSAAKKAPAKMAMATITPVAFTVNLGSLIDQYGLLLEQIKPIEDTIKAADKLEKQIKALMKEHDFLDAEGKLFAADRKITPTETLDTEKVKEFLGNKLPKFLKAGERVSLNVRLK